MVTVLEKTDDGNNNWLWTQKQEMETEGENSDEEIHTYRISNPTTPIQDLEKIPSEVDLTVLWDDTSGKHVMNNLLYGNFKKQFESKWYLLYI